MTYTGRLSICIGLLAVWCTPADADDEAKPIKVVELARKEPVRFEQDIRPILVKKCVVCHSGKVIEGDLDLSSYKSLLKGGERGPAVKPGKSAESLLVKAAGRTAEPLMPPPDKKDAQPLTPEELALIKLWIDQGTEPPAAGPRPLVLRRLSPAVHLVRAVAVASDKSLVVAGRANAVHVYSAESGDFVRTLLDSKLAAADGKKVEAAHLAVVESLAFSPDAKTLASGSLQEIALWDAGSGDLKRKLRGFADRVVALDFSTDGRYLATGGGAATVEGEVKVFEATTGKLVLEIERGHSDTVFGVRFSPAGDKLATCGADLSIKVFAFPSGKLLKKLEGHTHHVLDVAWQADGKLLASAGADKMVRLWDYASGEQLTRINRGGGRIETILLAHEKQVNRLMFVGEKPEILTCSGNQPAQLWQLSMQERPGNYTKPYMQGRRVRSFGDGIDYLYGIGISPDGAVVAAGGQAGIVWLYNGTDGKLIKRLLPPGVE